MSCDVLHSSPGGVWTSDSAHSLARQSSSDHASSLFPVNNPALVHGRWEDDIIWDSEAVPRIPRPVIPRLDPNDPHVILGIPEEPTANLSSEKEGKKVVTTACSSHLCIRCTFLPHPAGWAAEVEALHHEDGRQGRRQRGLSVLLPRQEGSIQPLQR